MQVPQLQFAQVPLIQPRSEAAEFSNALLKAGAMRQERRKEELARAAQEQQRAFENEMAQKQFGLQEQNLTLQQESGQRADKQLADQLQTSELARQQATQSIEANARAVEKEVKAQKFRGVLAANSDQLKKLYAAGDQLGVLNLMQDLAVKNGTVVPEDMIELVDASLKVLKTKDDLATNELQRSQYRAQMATEQVKQLKLKTEMLADSSKGLTVEDAQKQSKLYLDAAGNNQTEISKSETARLGLKKLEAGAMTVDSLKEVQQTLDPQSEEFKIIGNTLARMKGNLTPEEKQAILKETRTVFSGLITEVDNNIKQYKAAYTQNMKEGNALLALANRPPVADMYSPNSGGVPIVTGGADPTMLGSPYDVSQQAKGQQHMEYMDKVNAQKATGFTGSQANLNTVFSAFNATKNLPLINRSEGGIRPSKATSFAEGDPSDIPPWALGNK